MPRRLRDLIVDLTGGSPDEPSFWERLLAWPPDVFAITSAVLAESGAYRLCVSPPSCAWAVCHYREIWIREILRDASEWRAALEEPTPRPPEGIVFAAADLRAALDLPVRAFGATAEIESQPALRRACLSTFRLHALADESSADLLAVDDGKADEKTGSAARLRARKRLFTSGSLASFETDRLRVLPKLRTPASGITLRSLSHHLSAHRSEIDVTWVRHLGEDLGLVARDERRMNLLLIPWPFEIEARDLVATQPMWREHPTDYLSFAFSPPLRVAEITRCVTDAVAACRKKGAEVHGVVLPEAAVAREELDAVRATLDDLGVGFLLAGVRGQRRNEAHLALRLRHQWTAHAQPKHHRWCLDGEQIHQYHLGAALHPSRRYWEDIDVPERQLRFVSLSSWLTLCHLVCEDLARLDPVSDVIRSAGPNLVIALLLDGPQLEARWPGRYASVLADDPGSSVLTLTSLGMVKRCLPRGRTPSRVIALWKDSRRGVQELALDPSARGLLLSICGFKEKEWTADGRPGPENPALLVLAAVEQVAF